MLFNAPEFIFLFLPTVVAVFFGLHRVRQHTLARVWLVASSLFFYGFWNSHYLILIGASIVFNYAIGGFVTRAATVIHRRRLIGLGVAANLAVLGYFKYANFFLTTVNALGGSHFALLQLALPLGISFFTFQQIAYLVDCYGSDRHYDPVNYALFVTFFPHLIAGPLVHHQTM